MNGRKRVAVIFGGPSMEYYAACQATAGFIDHIDDALFEVLKIGITPNGKWYYTQASSEEIYDGEKWMLRDDNKVAVFTPIQDEKCFLILDNEKYYKEEIDLVFPYVVGYGGEDGRIPGLLDLANIPYVGCGVAASACSIDKELTRMFADACGCKQPKCTIVSKEEYINKLISYDEMVSFGYPVYVKPANGGTSVGVSRATNHLELVEALEESFKYDNKTLIEEEIGGTEIKVAVLGNEEIEYGAICEIFMPKGTVNDYATKTQKSSRKDIPAQLDLTIEEEIKRQTKLIYQKLNCRGFARVDFFLTEEKELYFNEINTIPGLGKTSIYSVMFEQAGVDFKDLLTKLLYTALE